MPDAPSRYARIAEMRNQGLTRAAIAAELGCSIATVARELATARKGSGLPVDLMQINREDAVHMLMAAESQGKIRPDWASRVNGPGALAVQVYKALDPRARALVRKPGLRAFADTIRQSKSTAHRRMQNLARAAGELPPLDKARHELRMARNAVKRARAAFEDDPSRWSIAAWAELVLLESEVEELVEQTKAVKVSRSR